LGERQIFATSSSDIVREYRNRVSTPTSNPNPNTSRGLLVRDLTDHLRTILQEGGGTHTRFGTTEGDNTPNDPNNASPNVLLRHTDPNTMSPPHTRRGTKYHRPK
jgi:hypothetical protein